MIPTRILATLCAIALSALVVTTNAPAVVVVLAAVGSLSLTPAALGMSASGIADADVRGFLPQAFVRIH